MLRVITEILRRYPPDYQPSRVEPLGSAGGMSGAQFWRITAPRGSLVLRRWPTGHPTPDRLRFVHAVLRHAAQRGIGLLPVPIPTRDGLSFVENGDHLWELAPWMPGAANYEQSPSAERLRAAMTALARFHTAVADFPVVSGPQSAVTRHFARLNDLMRGGINELFRAVTDATWPELAPLARQFLSALHNVIPRAMANLEPLVSASLPLQPCIRDIWHDHILFTGDDVTGLIDFGAVEIDTPATDVARLLGSLAGDDATGWQTGITAYSAVRPLSQQEGLAVRALDASGTILGGCNWIRWIYIDRRQFDDRAKILERFRRILARLR
jgi:homoserine kinase type II